MFIQPYARAFVLASLSPPCWAMGDMLSASMMTDRRGGDEFFFDTFHQHWRLHWEDTWWTFELVPVFDDDPVVGMLRKGACWVSDFGRIWYGPYPEEWCRQYHRGQASRRWLCEEKLKCKCVVMSLHQTALPVQPIKVIIA